MIHQLHQRVNDLLAKVVAAVAIALEGIGFVDEQHAAHGLLHLLSGPQGALAHMVAHQLGTVSLHHMSSLQIAHLVE